MGSRSQRHARADRSSGVAASPRANVVAPEEVADGGSYEAHPAHVPCARMLREESGGRALSGALQAVHRLRKLEPFARLPADRIEQVAKLLLYMEREPGQAIVRQGASGDELFVIGRGAVEVSVQGDDGQERVVGTLSDGDYFGEISFLRRTPRTATVRAIAPTELHVLRRTDFDSVLSELGEGLLAQMEKTARRRVADTRAKVAAA